MVLANWRAIIARADRRWPMASRCIEIAYANLTQHPTRLAVSLIGTAVPIVLLFLQIAFLSAARYEVTRLYEDFDFDLSVVSREYQFLYSSGGFDRARMIQAKAVLPGATTFNLNVNTASWTNAESASQSSLLVVGLDDAPEFIRDTDLRDGLEKFSDSRSVLADEYSSADFGALDIGTDASVADQPVRVVGLFRLGFFFYADGAAAVLNGDFPRYTGQDARETTIGLIRLPAGADVARAKTDLIAALPADVRVLTRAELIGMEQAFFISTKPIGIMLGISMAIAFLVGSVILLQVLSTEIVNRLKEFAVLKAMGFDPRFIFGVGLAEIAALALAAFIPALLVSAAILWAVAHATHLPAAVTPLLVAEVLSIVLAMCALSVVFALKRIAGTDPAELY